MPSILYIAFLAVLFSVYSTQSYANTKNNILLPDLGDASSGLVSPAQEYRLGQMWLRMYRSQVRTSSDPLLHEYIENLLADLVQYSELKDHRLDLLVVPNPTINAFAVPGGVIGVHTGLFLYAGDEDQFASVLAHELAHLSQRHYARSREKQSNSSIPTMAGILASLVLAATAGGDAGMAALTATQAAALDSQLRFSRQNEQEADRIGMLTMVNAGRNPDAGAQMFERMLRETRYRSRPPEFLLTHPVTESRVADARNRAQRYPKRQYNSNEEFYLMQVRARLAHETNYSIAAKRFANELEGDTPSMLGSRYGLALSLTESGRYDDARRNINLLLKEKPDHIAFHIAAAKLDAKEKKFDQAQNRLQKQLQYSPQSHSLNIALAEILMDAGRYAQAEITLKQHSQRRPKDEYTWYLLAEVHGLAGDILGLHQARAEYFILNGIFDKARRQLENALKITGDDQYTKALIQQRLLDVARMIKEVDMR
nr:M48 family metalloprotease [Marinibactrum halimedae]